MAKHVPKLIGVGKKEMDKDLSQRLKMRPAKETGRAQRFSWNTAKKRMLSG
jgi:hypothetical protein